MQLSTLAYWLSFFFAITSIAAFAVLLYYWKKTQSKTQELKAAHSQYQLLYQRLLMAKESVDMGVWDWNVETDTIEWDAQLYNMYELPQDCTITQEVWAKLIHPEDLEEFNKRLNLVAKSGGLQRFEAKILRKNNAIRHLLFTMNAIPPRSGSSDVHIVGVNIDITHQKNLEHDLLDAKDNAESANLTKSSFLASMSHELRTPMNGIIGMLRLLSKSRLSEDQTRKLEIAHNSAQTLLSILNDILDFSKIEANELTLEEYDFDLRGLIEGVTQSLVFRANEKGVELLLDLSEVHASKVKGDPTRLQQVLINLLSNAIKFTDEGEIIVSASLTELNDNLLRLVCSVEDTGIGIPGDKQTQLFNAFSRVESSSLRQNTGTGLGLAICKKLVQMMGGQIGFTSQYGQGSNFSFDVLLQPASYGAEIRPETANSPVYILLVDSNKSHLEILEKQLKGWGANVTLASSSWDALSACDNAHNLFQVALISKDMPDMTGEQLAEKIRSESKYDSIKLILVSSIAAEISRQSLYRKGFSDVFSKPLTTLNYLSIFSLVSVARLPVKSKKEINSIENIKPKKKIGNKNTRILLVEDNKINQFLVEGILEDHNLSLQCVINGVDAIATLQASFMDQPFTLILMDCHLPKMDGYEATRLIRQGQAGKRYTNIPIIAMTAAAMKGDREKCLECGMNDYISKPIDEDLFIDMVQKWIALSVKSDNI